MDVKNALDLSHRLLAGRIADASQRLAARGHPAEAQDVVVDGFQGLLVPSAARPGGRNVVLFRDKVLKSRLRIIRKNKLPKKT